MFIDRGGGKDRGVVSNCCAGSILAKLSHIGNKNVLADEIKKRQELLQGPFLCGFILFFIQKYYPNPSHFEFYRDSLFNLAMSGTSHVGFGRVVVSLRLHSGTVVSGTLLVASVLCLY